MNDRILYHIISLIKQNHHKSSYYNSLEMFMKDIVYVAFNYVNSEESRNYIDAVGEFFEGTIFRDIVASAKVRVQILKDQNNISKNDAEILTVVELAQKIYDDPYYDSTIVDLLERIYLMNVLPYDMVKEIDGWFKDKFYTINVDFPY